jgi:flagellar hook-length control protein FliK
MTMDLFMSQSLYQTGIRVGGGKGTNDTRPRELKATDTKDSGRSIFLHTLSQVVNGLSIPILQNSDLAESSGAFWVAGANTLLGLDTLTAEVFQSIKGNGGTRLENPLCLGGIGLGSGESSSDSPGLPGVSASNPDGEQMLQGGEVRSQRGLSVSDGFGGGKTFCGFIRVDAESLGKEGTSINGNEEKQIQTEATLKRSGGHFKNFKGSFPVPVEEGEGSVEDSARALKGEAPLMRPWADSITSEKGTEPGKLREDIRALDYLGEIGPRSQELKADPQVPFEEDGKSGENQEKFLTAEPMELGPRSDPKTEDQRIGAAKDLGSVFGQEGAGTHGEAQTELTQKHILVEPDTGSWKTEKWVAVQAERHAENRFFPGEINLGSVRNDAQPAGGSESNPVSSASLRTKADSTPRRHLGHLDPQASGPKENGSTRDVTFDHTTKRSGGDERSSKSIPTRFGTVDEVVASARTAQTEFSRREFAPMFPATQSSGNISENVLPKDTPETSEKPYQAEVMTQVVEKAVLHSAAGNREITITLKPEFLGHLRMHILTENHHVSLKISTEIPLVKEIIEGNIGHLKAALQNHGLEIHKFDVFIGHDSTQYGGGYENETLQERGIESAENPMTGDLPSEEGENQLQPSQDDTGKMLVDFFA